MNSFSIFVNLRKFTPKRIEIEHAKLNEFLKQHLQHKEIEMSTKAKSHKNLPVENITAPIYESKKILPKHLKTIIK